MHIGGLKRYLPQFIFVVSIAFVGSIIILATRAATYQTSSEVENGTIGGNATRVSDSNASAGSAIKFGTTADGSSQATWKPALNTPWMWLLGHALNTSTAGDMGTGVKTYSGSNAPDPVMYDIDGFENTAATVTALHGRNAHVVCYISAGTSENWRSDYSSFTAAVKGSAVDGWAGENWLDVRNLAVLGPIMQARLDMCKNKGFDAVEFDNVDGYANSSGFPLTAANQLTYNKALAQWAHDRGMSAALKNDIDQIPQLWQDFDFAINEECNAYNECANYTTYFVANNKAVFQVEYSGSTSSFCPAMNAANINSVKFPLNLTGNRQPCR